MCVWFVGCVFYLDSGGWLRVSEIVDFGGLPEAAGRL